MWLLELLAWIAAELFIARAASESKPEPLSIIHADEPTPEKPNEWQMADGRSPMADSR